MVDPTSYVIVEKVDGSLMGFVRFDKDDRVVVSEDIYDEAKKFLSKAAAMAMKYRLNNIRHSRGVWEIMPLYI